MKLTDFRAAATLGEARAILKELGPVGLPMAGGTSLVFTSEKDERVAVDINRAVPAGIVRENGTYRIGSTTRLAALQSFRGDGWVLDRVAVRLASQQIRNMSTIGGNISRVFPWADFPAVLLALNASMVIAGDAERVLSADEFFDGQPARLFQPGELLMTVNVPVLAAGQGFGYRKQTQTSAGFSLMTAAVWVEADGSAVKTARVAIGAGVPFPGRVTSVEELLKGRKASEAAFREAAEKGLAELKFKGGDGMSEEYIGHLAAVLVGDALNEAWAAAKGGAA